MLNNKNLNFGIDILLHVFILFTFLTIFFFVYISKLEVDNLDNVTTNAINYNVKFILDNFKQWSNSLSIDIDWKKIDDFSQKLQNSKENIEIKNTNKNLFKNSMLTIAVFFIILNLIIIYLNFFTNYMDFKMF